MFSRFIASRFRYKKVHPNCAVEARYIASAPRRRPSFLEPFSPPPSLANEPIVIPEENVAVLYSIIRETETVEIMRVLTPIETVYYDWAIPTYISKNKLPYAPNKNFHWMNDHYLKCFNDYSVFITYPETPIDYQYQILPLLELFTFIAVDEHNHKLHDALENIIIELNVMHYSDDVCNTVLLNMLADIISRNCGVNIKIIKASVAAPARISI